MLTGQILLQLLVILLVVQLFGYLCQRIGQQWVIGEILAGDEHPWAGGVNRPQHWPGPGSSLPLSLRYAGDHGTRDNHDGLPSLVLVRVSRPEPAPC
jgi:hypothetical protein